MQLIYLIEPDIWYYMKKDSSKNIYPSIIKDPLLCCSFAERKESNRSSKWK